jgi:hypothetical protein
MNEHLNAKRITQEEAFCTLNFGYLFLSSIVWLYVGIPEGGGVFILIFNISLILFVVPFGYFSLLGILAGRRIAFSEKETRRIVAEIDTQCASRSGWISKVLGLPFPIEDSPG